MFYFSYLDWFAIVQISLLLRRKGKKEKMNKLFSKIAALSVGLAMAVGVGVALGHEGVREVRAATDIPATNLSSSMTCTVNGVDGVKANKAAGATITVPKEAGNATVNFHAAAWKGEGVAHSLSFTNATCSTSSITLVADSGASNNSPFTLVGSEDDYLFSVDLVQIDSSADMTITIGGVSSKRFIVWGASYESGETPTGPFTVTYNGNGATSGSMTDSNEYDSGDTVTIMACAYMRTDYEVTGWNTKADGSGTAYGLSAQFTITSNVTLYAQWHSLVPEPGSEDDPYTVAEARTAIDAAGSSTLSDKYVSGIICQIDSYNSKYKSITYWISDDGTTTNMLEVYSGKGIGGADFSGTGDLTLKYSVVVKGNLKKYNSTTYEFDVSSEIISYTAPVVVSVNSVKSAPSEVYVGQSVLTSDVILNVTMSGGASAEMNPTSIVLDTSVAATGVVGKAYYEEVGYAEFVIDVIAVDFSGTHILKSNTTDYEPNLDNAKFHSLVDNSAAFSASGISNVRLGGSPNTSDIMFGSSDSTGGSWTLTAPEGYVITTVVFTGFPSKSGGANLTVGGIQRTVTSTTYTDQLFYVLGQSVQMITSSRFWTSEIRITLEKVTTGSVALAFGTAALAMTAEECAAGAVTEGTWAEVKTVFQHVDADFHSEAELVRGSDESVEAIRRYKNIIEKYGYEDFLNKGYVQLAPYFAPSFTNNNSYIIIIVISAVSVMSFGLALFLRKKRSK